GLLQETARQRSAAERTYKEALRLDTHSAVSVLALANFYTEQHRWNDAEQQYHQAIAIDPKSAPARAAFARLYLAQGRKGEAQKLLETATRDLHDNPDGYRLLADFYLTTGDLDKAIAEYSAILERHPGDLRSKKNSVQLLILANRLDEAQKLNDEVL